MSLLTATRMVELLCGAGILVSSLELWAVRADYRRTGAFAWTVFGSRAAFLGRAGLAPAIDGAFPATLLLRAAAALALMFAMPDTPLELAALAILAGTTLLLHARLSFGKDGSDQMAAVIVIALFLGRLGPASETSMQLAMWFIALQSCLSYLASGVAKAAGPLWRSGEAVRRILATRLYGDAPVAAWLSKRPAAARLLAWGTILFEVTFPFAVFSGSPGVVAATLGAGVLFHLGIARFMGLNSFLPVFTATYPALWYCGVQGFSALLATVGR